MKNQNDTWIKSIPKDWAIGRISYKYQVQLGKMLQPEPKNLDDIKKPYLRSANLDWSGVKLEDVKEMWFSPNDLKKYKIEPSDVLVSEGGDVGRTSFWNNSIEMYIQNAVNRLRPLTEESNPKFLFYWFSFLKTHGLIDIMCDSSTISHYTAEKVKATQLVFPTFSEQTLIAHFLDQKTSQIDKLVEQKEKLLKFLAEKRTAIITQAVTKGLDPTVEMKDSGIDWLGKIPKEWEVKKIKYLSSKVGDGLHGTPEYTDETEFYFINGNNLGNGVIQITPQTRTISEEQFFANDLGLTPQTVLLSINGTIGNVAFYKGEKVMLGKSAAYIKFFDWIDIKFIRWFMESSVFENYYELELTGTTIKNLSLESIKNSPVTFPNKSDQEKIVKYLDSKVESIDRIKSRIKKSILKLKEYREALITSAVTGQIDVRKEVSNG